VNLVIECLEAKFERIVSRHGNALDAGYTPSARWWRGPWTIRPMIEFVSVMDAGQPMRVIPSDYADPERVCL
jgi:hypothetical protein